MLGKEAGIDPPRRAARAPVVDSAVFVDEIAAAVAAAGVPDAALGLIAP